MSESGSTRINKTFYSRSDVVEHYFRANYLSGAEQELFGKYWRPGLRVLDLGVGGGRTSEFLARDAAEYVGIDYAPDMVEMCCKRFPTLDFRTMDAADLSAFPDGHFDLVVFSFNGLGYLHPESERLKCVDECQRVLKPGGHFIFSLHYARSLLFRLPAGQGLRPLPGWLFKSMRRLFRRVLLPAFWRGQGYFTDVDSKIVACMTTPVRVKEMLMHAGFQPLDVLGDDYPLSNIPCMTRWYYYAARK